MDRTFLFLDISRILLHRFYTLFTFSLRYVSFNKNYDDDVYYYYYCLVLHFVYVYLLSFTRAHSVIGPLAVELAHK
jgi:hypothetical protein